MKEDISVLAVLHAAPPRGGGRALLPALPCSEVPTRVQICEFVETVRDSAASGASHGTLFKFKLREPQAAERERDSERDLLGNNVHDGGVQGAAR